MLLVFLYWWCIPAVTSYQALYKIIMARDKRGSSSVFFVVSQTHPGRGVCA